MKQSFKIGLYKTTLDYLLFKLIVINYIENRHRYVSTILKYEVIFFLFTVEIALDTKIVFLITYFLFTFDSSGSMTLMS